MVKMVPYEAFACPCGAGDVVLRESYKPKTRGKLYYACPRSKTLSDVNFLWKEERVRLLVGSLGASTTPIYSPGSSSTPIYSPGSSTPPRYSLGALTPKSYSLGTSRNAECSNCKHLLDKIMVLEATKIHNLGRHVARVTCAGKIAARSFITRSDKSYNPPVNPNDQQENSEIPVNFDSDDEDDEPTPQPKTQNPKPTKETPLPYKPKIPYPQHSAIKHSYSNDDTCFGIDVIDEILEDFDALLDEGSKILHSIEGTLLEEEIFAEFDELMAMTADEIFDSESDIKEPPFEKITINTNYKIKKSLEEPPTDLELKPFPDNLEYVFLKEPSFFPIIISSQLSKEKKNKLISILKKHKQAFAWKTTDIPGVCPSFYKHKIQLLDDKKPVVQKQRRSIT
nr:reverse transcriptase domain-containing protein [Tanacetum cinerariifolium]